MGKKLSLLAMVIVLLNGCTMIKDNVINPIKAVFPSRTGTSPNPTSPAPPVNAVSETPEPPKKEVAGVYEHQRIGVIYRRVLLENGILEYYLNDTKAGESRWSEKDDELIITTADGVTVTEYLEFEPNGDLSWIAIARNGARHEIEKLTFKRIRYHIVSRQNGKDRG